MEESFTGISELQYQTLVNTSYEAVMALIIDPLIRKTVGNEKFWKENMQNALDNFKKGIGEFFVESIKLNRKIYIYLILKDGVPIDPNRLDDFGIRGAYQALRVGNDELWKSLVSRLLSHFNGYGINKLLHDILSYDSDWDLKPQTSSSFVSGGGPDSDKAEKLIIFIGDNIFLSQGNLFMNLVPAEQYSLVEKYVDVNNLPSNIIILTFLDSCDTCKIGPVKYMLDNFKIDQDIIKEAIQNIRNKKACSQVLELLRSML